MLATFNPTPFRHTEVVDATKTVSAPVDTPSFEVSPTNVIWPTTVLVYNAGPALAFVDRFYTTDTPPITAQNFTPIHPGTSLALTAGQNSRFAFASEGVSRVYASFGG